MLVLAAGCASLPEARAAREARRHGERGDIALALRRYDEAEAEYRAALSLRADDETALVGSLRVAAARDQLGPALEAYEALARSAPGAAAELAGSSLCPLLLRAAAASIAEPAPAAGLARARRARAEGCPAADVDAVLARALIAEAGRIRSSQPESATELYLEAVRTDPGQSATFRQAAIHLLERQQRRSALSLLSEALLQHPGDRALQSLMLAALAYLPPARGVADEPGERAEPGAERGNAEPSPSGR